MVVEKLIKTPLRVIQIPYADYIWLNNKYRYHLIPFVQHFNVIGEYWYDGAKFYIGSHNGEYAEQLIEATTFMNGSFPLTGYKKPEVLIKQFKMNLLKSKQTIHEIIKDARLRNLDLEAWINFLII